MIGFAVVMATLSAISVVESKALQQQCDLSASCAACTTVKFGEPRKEPRLSESSILTRISVARMSVLSVFGRLRVRGRPAAVRRAACQLLIRADVPKRRFYAMRRAVGLSLVRIHQRVCGCGDGLRRLVRGDVAVQLLAGR